MGNKFIITEEEKNRIRVLYENDTTPPDEYEVVGNFNPFVKTEYLPFFRPYSKELKDGDLFYGQTEEKCKEKLTDKKVENSLNGKTFRIDDTIYKISGLNYYYFNKIGVMLGRRPYGIIDIFEIKNENDKLYPKYTLESEPQIAHTGLPENVKNAISEKIPTKTAKDIPDCYFELRRIKRKQTDFQP
jgi:hypothetical protein